MPTVKAMYDCQADKDDELTFFAGELIHVTGMEEPGWWVRTRPVLAGRRRPQLRSLPVRHCPAAFSLSNCCHWVAC